MHTHTNGLHTCAHTQKKKIWKNTYETINNACEQG